LRNTLRNPNDHFQLALASSIIAKIDSYRYLQSNQLEGLLYQYSRSSNRDLVAAFMVGAAKLCYRSYTDVEIAMNPVTNDELIVDRLPCASAICRVVARSEKPALTLFKDEIVALHRQNSRFEGWPFLTFIRASF
jgi:hypothetical protein